MPKLDLHEPQFDDQTGELINKDEIRQAFGIVKEFQTELMQPPFYTVEAGDFWEIPPLAGYEDDEDEEEEEEEEAPAVAARTARGGMMPGASARRTSGRSPGRAPGRGTGRGAVRGGGRGVGPGPGRGTGGGGVSAARSEEEEKRAARKQIRADLTEAKKMLGRKEYEEARRLAEQIAGDNYASKGDIRKAQQVIKAAERWLRIEAERGGSTRSPTARVGRGMGRGMVPTGLGRGSPVTGRDEIELVSNPESGEPAVWFHDDTVEAGKTYRYRMRVKLWNRYVGRMRSMKDPEQAKSPIVAGEWSFASEPITVTPSTYFFVIGGRPADHTASVDVHKWRDGFYKKERFDVTVGDVIGDVRKIKVGEYDEEGDEIVDDVDFTTGVVVLDLRFNETVEQRRRGKDGVFGYSEKKGSTVLVYLDPADGQVKERVSLFDRRDPKKKELEDEEW